MRDRIFRVLVVEDNEAEVALLQMLLQQREWPCRLLVATDGDEAVKVLESTLTGSQTTPDVVLLDLNLPTMDGHSVLAWIRGQRALRHLPVIVFTSSLNPQDVARSYDHRCNCYIRKPSNLDDYQEVVRAIERFWTEVATLPSR